ncbi:hypothetical protein MAR_012138 [Mya arenaria]|uniref:Uncharacterized protein n=1 Tax=Mya arenaria TaxID=6604 RepID=A0ABY7FZQ2_MYAAR|nr:hypothetical protein MAR_012138 [Mya arenaria]
MLCIILIFFIDLLCKKKKEDKVYETLLEKIYSDAFSEKVKSNLKFLLGISSLHGGAHDGKVESLCRDLVGGGYHADARPTMSKPGSDHSPHKAGSHKMSQLQKF